MIDATSNLDRQDSKYFRFVTPTSVGGLPLGFCVVSSERTDVLTEAPINDPDAVCNVEDFVNDHRIQAEPSSGNI